MGHLAETRHTARNFLIVHTIAVCPTINCTLLFVTGEDDIARFDSRRYRYIQPYLLVSYWVKKIISEYQNYIYIGLVT
jgi:hypothetical protein